MLRSFSIAALLFLFSSSALPAQGGNEGDEKAIRGIEAQWETGWNAHDVEAMSRLLTADADLINARGRRARGRDEFIENNNAAHRGVYRESVWKTHEVEVKFATPELAIVHVYWSLRGDLDEHGKKRPEHQGISTRVVVKREGRWLILTSQATSLQQQ